MIVSATKIEYPAAEYVGLRMTAEEFFQLPEDGIYYQLIDGVVFVSPSPSLKHQRISGEILVQLSNFLIDHPISTAVMEMDVHLGQGPTGQDLVYRPDVLFIKEERVPKGEDHPAGAPDLVVEVISPHSHSMDTRTKKDDYQRCGVREYWIVNPQEASFTFYRLQEGRFNAVKESGDFFTSEAVCGFKLDLAPLRTLLQS